MNDYKAGVARLNDYGRGGCISIKRKLKIQIDYYTNFINKNPDWEFVGVYTDAGISGVNTKHRDGFNRMVADALDGKIDLIVTKSISRFARNTVDTLVTIQNSKKKGLNVILRKKAFIHLIPKGNCLLQ